MTCSDIYVDAVELRRFTAGIFKAVGMAEDDAAIAADVLVTADLRGHESHGVARAEHFYVRPLLDGRIAARATPVTVRETSATLVLDAGNGMGHPATRRAMDLCIAKARESGVCVAVVRRSNHFGIAGYYPLLAVEHDMIGVCCTTAGTLVVPTGGRDALLGTNPIALAAPARRGRPFMLDMATSVVPLGKIEVKARRGEPLPPGWAVDERRRTATDAQAVLDRLHNPSVGGGLAPLGGLEAGHKGYGLAVMVDILSGLLAGARASIHLSDAMRRGEAAALGHLVAAMDIAAFAEVDAFKQAMDDYIDALHAAPPATEVDRVLVAGDPEFETEQRRSREGIPLHHSVWESLRGLSKEFGVLLPAGIRGRRV